VEARVLEVIDGDTIKVSIEEAIYTVRYIGMDAPETRYPGRPVEWMGREATLVNRALVEDNTVLLEEDISETDRFGRLLRYVWVGDLLVNEVLVRQGYAQVSTYPPDVKYQERLLSAQEVAIEAGRGLWGPTPTATTEATATPTPAQTVAPTKTGTPAAANTPA
jgi:micrococcal nuclease